MIFSFNVTTAFHNNISVTYTSYVTSPALGHRTHRQRELDDRLRDLVENKRKFVEDAKKMLARFEAEGLPEKQQSMLLHVDHVLPGKRSGASSHSHIKQLLLRGP